jgi:GxxExxY protein
MHMLEQLIKDVWDELGPGYSESIYHNALEVQLRENGIGYETERIIPVSFHGHVIGNLRADLILNDTIVELKSVRALTEPNRTQIQLYMKLLEKDGVLVNFGPDKFQIEHFTLSKCIPT